MKNQSFNNNHINYSKNTLFTVGIEEEYMICDPENYELIPKANEIIQSIDNKFKNRFSYELILSEIESNTKICKTVNEAIDEILLYRNILSKLGNSLDFVIGINGTHPTALPKDQKFVDNNAYNWVLNELSYYASRNITFSTHFHIGLNDPETSISICNALRRWISPLLALSVNSPFFEGILTGMHSSRTFQFSTFPRTEIPDYLDSYNSYKTIIENYVKSKSIVKPRQIWWKIRPHIDFGTIEFRMCDAQRSISNIKMLASLCQALVHTEYISNDFSKSRYKLEYLNDGLWKASRYGINGLIVDPLTSKILSIKDFIYLMYEYCYKSLCYFGNDQIIDSIDSICKEGTEHDLQLKIFNKYGIDELKKYLIKKVEYSL